MRLLLAVPLLATCLACLASDTLTGGREDATVVVISTLPGDTLGYSPSEVVVEAGPVALSFQNRSDVEHNLTFTGGLGIETRTIVQPGEGDELAISPLPPGSYQFVCTIHHVFAGDMAGILIVQPSATQ